MESSVGDRASNDVIDVAVCEVQTPIRVTHSAAEETLKSEIPLMTSNSDTPPGALTKVVVKRMKRQRGECLLIEEHRQVTADQDTGTAGGGGTEERCRGEQHRGGTDCDEQNARTRKR